MNLQKELLVKKIIKLHNSYQSVKVENVKTLFSPISYIPINVEETCLNLNVAGVCMSAGKKLGSEKRKKSFEGMISVTYSLDANEAVKRSTKVCASFMTFTVVKIEAIKYRINHSL